VYYIKLLLPKEKITFSQKNEKIKLNHYYFTTKIM